MSEEWKKHVTQLYGPDVVSSLSMERTITARIVNRMICSADHETSVQLFKPNCYLEEIDKNIRDKSTRDYFIGTDLNSDIVICRPCFYITRGRP